MEKIFLVTGCNGGIGAAICKTLIEQGGVVVGVDLIHKSNNNITHQINADLTDSKEHQNIINFIKDKYNRLDGVINVAAVQICKPIWEMEEEEWDKIYACNVKTIYLFVKHGITLLKNSQGSIINIGSVHGIATSDKIAGYASSKAAVIGLTRNLALELGKYNINVNCISPGAIDTPMLRAGLKRGHVQGNSSDDLVKELGKKHLMGRVGKAEEIASLVSYLVDETKANFITGANFVIDGGATIKLSTE